MDEKMKAMREILDQYYPVHSFAPEIGNKIRDEATLAIQKLYAEELAALRRVAKAAQDRQDFYLAHKTFQEGEEFKDELEMILAQEMDALIDLKSLKGEV